MKIGPWERRRPVRVFMQSVLRKKATLGTLLATLATGCVAHISEPVNPEPNLTRSEAAQLIPAGNRETEPGEKAPGIIVYIDPKSGEFTTGPSEALPAQRPQQSLEKAGETASQLHETLSPVPGGGVTIHLGERFFTPLTATIDADGKLRLEHLPALPDSRDKK
jgi:hypothetical protein